MDKNNYKLKYMIIDIETLKDYWSFQWCNESMEKAKIFECTNDKHFYKVYKSFKSLKRSIYCYSIDFDKLMINSLCKLVEAKETNIAWKLRRISDYSIKGNINYFRLNKEFWCDNYFKLIEKENITSKEAFETSKLNLQEKYKDNNWIINFLNEFDYLLGKSKVFKELNIIDLPKMLYYFSIRKDGIIRPTISLKNIQLSEEKTNIKFDFNKYEYIKDVKKDGLYNTFKEYSLNDVDFLHRYFKDKCVKTIMTRVYACQAIQKFYPDFTFNDKMIHSENNTTLLVKAFTLPENKRNQKITMNYKDYIKNTGVTKFDNFINFVNEHKENVPKDKDLKKLYCEYYDEKYIYDDKNIVEGSQIDIKIGSVTTFDLYGTLVNSGLGGIHGALDNYKNKNLWHLDYTSLYPSIILQFKELYKNIINVELYETLYNFRNKEIKSNIKKLKKEQETIINMIEQNGNDSADIAEYEPQLDFIDKKLEMFSNLESGVKLLLNTPYGILNSNFNLPITNKTLGRFICLYGQYKAIELCKLIIKHSPDSKFVNINTDGIIVDNITKEAIDKIVTEDKDGYLTLGITQIENIIQYDVNNYLKVINGSLKTKGTTFGTGIKQTFTKNEKIMCNMKNALSLFMGKKVDYLPIFFHNTKKKSSVVLEGEKTSMDKIYYLTDENNGKKAIKNVAKPLVINIDGEIMYFTENKKEAKISEYQKFAELTMDKINNFTMNKIQNNMKYVSNPLTPESDEAKISILRSQRLKINKILKNYNVTCIIVDENDEIMIHDKNKIDSKYSNYTLTNIIKSKEAYGLSLLNNIDDIVFVATRDEFTQDVLSSKCILNISHNISKFKCYMITKEYYYKSESNTKSVIKLLESYKIPLFTIDQKFTFVSNNIV